MGFETQSTQLLNDYVSLIAESFKDLPDFTAEIELETLQPVLKQAAIRMQDNFPYAHPFYAGQMLKPPHPIARLAYMMALWVNPNNHALDGGRASSQMEKEVVRDIAQMFGWTEAHIGHLTSGGTMANLEALWIADQIHPGKTIVASEMSHYTHQRITQVLKIPFESIAVDSLGRMDCGALEERLKTGAIGTVVVTLGTTGLGAVDPLDKILALQNKYSFRVHIDSAYGGYFKLASNLDADVTRAYAVMSGADSIVIDPHKSGLQPYGCGCIIFSDPSVGKYYQHDSPYTYFTSDDLHLGEISLECSRAGASAVALWSTMKLLPLSVKGEFAQQIMSTHQAAKQFYGYLQSSDNDRTILPPDTNIVVWGPKAVKASTISELSQQRFESAAQQGLHLATINLTADWLQTHWPDVEMDQDRVICLRSCLMKAEHLDWVDRIWSLYKQLPD